MKRLSVPALLRLGFAIVVVHNVEEWLTIGPFLDAHRRSVREQAVRVKPLALAAAVEAVLLVPLLVGVHAISTRLVAAMVSHTSLQPP